MKNMPILYQNIMYGLPSDFARDVFLWAVDMPNNDRMSYKAERFAREADQLRGTLVALLNITELSRQKFDTPQLSENQKDDLIRYVLTRHANSLMQGNLHPAYVNRSAA